MVDVVDGEVLEQGETYTPKFEARLKPDSGCVWEVWDVTHPAECNHYTLVTVDSKGAADDWHEPIAVMIAAALNARLDQKHPNQILTAGKILDMSLCVGDGLSVYGEYEAISRTQDYVLLDTNHPIEKEDVRRAFARALQMIERAQGASVGTITERRRG